jgi:very-short-patch-repair endonuclease
MPQLARTNSPLENDFLLWCERRNVPLPEVNVRVHGVLVDAYWAKQRLVVELDGGDNHSSPAQVRTDRANELTLRRHGLRVRRYSWDQVHASGRLVRDDLMAALARS